MGGGGKGGSQTTTTQVKLPPWIEEVAKQNLGVANEVAQMGYVPYGGPTVAALNPMQESAIYGGNMAAAAFGLPGGPTSAGGGDGITDPLTGLPLPTSFAGGVSGYSPMSLYEEALSAIPAGQRSLIDSFFIDPETGAPPTSPAVLATLGGGASKDGKGDSKGDVFYDPTRNLGSSSGLLWSRARPGGPGGGA